MRRYIVLASLGALLSGCTGEEPESAAPGGATTGAAGTTGAVGDRPMPGSDGAVDSGDDSSRGSTGGSESGGSGGAKPEPDASGVCLPTCVADPDCGSQQRCDDGVCRYAGCFADADCIGDERCLPSTVFVGLSECYAPCRGTGSCTPTSWVLGPGECNDGGCVPTGCPSQRWCDANTPEPGAPVICTHAPNTAIPGCYGACSTADDCGPDGITTSCEDGVCLSDCADDEECIAVYGVGWACAPAGPAR